MSPIATVLHDRHPGDAEAAGAAAAMAEDSGFWRGDIIGFVDPARGYDRLTLAIVRNRLPGEQLLVETITTTAELVIAESQVIVGGVQP